MTSRSIVDELLGDEERTLPERNADDLVLADERYIRELVSLREQKGLTIAEVARRMGIDAASVSRLESGVRDPHLSTLRRYAHAIGAKVRHLVADFELTEGFDPCIFERIEVEQDKVYLSSGLTWATPGDPTVLRLVESLAEEAYEPEAQYA
jgi:transcriptional regulator with XRE-family HTH domain